MHASRWTVPQLAVLRVLVDRRRPLGDDHTRMTGTAESGSEYGPVLRQEVAVLRRTNPRRVQQG